ncbi:MAG: NBR1-Ig-like domain-containing protein [Chloroflexota bacterium]
MAIAAMSCDVAFVLPAGPVFPTAAPGVVETIVAGTAGAAQTQTAALMRPTSSPTLTPTATRTPSLTPTFTPTFVFRLRSATPAKTSTPTLAPGLISGEYSCKLLDQDPADGSKLDAKVDFDAVWEVRNTGSATWDENNIDFAFFNGDKLHEQSVYDLNKSVKSGESINLIVDMVAPKDAGKYRTVWSLRRGNDDFCRVTLTINVK